MTAVRFVLVPVVLGALALPGAATAQDPVETNADNTVCNASVWVGSGSFRSGDFTIATPEQTIRLADHTGALGEQDPCAA